MIESCFLVELVNFKLSYPNELNTSILTNKISKFIIILFKNYIKSSEVNLDYSNQKLKLDDIIESQYYNSITSQVIVLKILSAVDGSVL